MSWSSHVLALRQCLRPLFVHLRARWTRVIAVFIVALVWGVSPAQAKHKVHTVYAGQRLASIAKRYNVTVEELCRENGISQKAPIHPGQKLLIPGTDDGAVAGSAKKGDAAEKPADDKQAPPSKPQGKTRVHVVQKGHTLSAIAGRYAITVSALCYANDLPRNAPLSVGQKVIIPHKTDAGGAYARKQRDRGDFDEPKSTDRESDAHPEASKTDRTPEKATRSWAPFVKAPWKRGFIKIRRYGRYWEGYVIGPQGQVLGQASNKINFVLGARSDGPRIDSALIRLIASISDKFGGRELRIVSGYRTKSFVAASQHKKGRALDFSIPGIPNEVLRDYLRTLDDVGVGYYPNSSFVHLDVRGYNSYWIDYAGPGEAPRKSSKKKNKKNNDSEHEHDAEELQQADKDPDAAAEESGSDEEPSAQDATEDEYSHGDPEPEAGRRSPDGAAARDDSPSPDDSAVPDDSAEHAED